MEPVAAIQIVKLPTGETRCQVKGMTLDIFREMMCDAIALIQPKLIQKNEEPQIQIPAPGIAAKLANGVRHD